jgi:hypothetical protein
MSGVARQFSILDAISDQRLFGSAFKDMSSWRAWLAFLAGLFALPMSEVWRACTGRSGFLIGHSATRMMVMKGWRDVVLGRHSSRLPGDS